MFLILANVTSDGIQTGCGKFPHQKFPRRKLPDVKITSSEDEINIKFLLTTMKPLHAGWVIDIYNELLSSEGRKVILRGWKDAAITDAIAKGLIGFTGESMDLFYDLDPFDQVDIPIETTCTRSFSSEEYINPECEDESEDDGQYLPGALRNPFTMPLH